MDTSGLSPWSFEIEFDEEEAARNGYDPDELYDCVGRIVEPMTPCAPLAGLGGPNPARTSSGRSARRSPCS